MKKIECLNQESIIIGKVKDKEEALGIVNIALIGIDKLPDGEDDRSDVVKFVSLDFKIKIVKMMAFQSDMLSYKSDPREDFHKMNHAYLLWWSSFNTENIKL